MSHQLHDMSFFLRMSSGQMLSSVEASQDLVPSSRLIRPCSPFGGLWWGQSSMMWSTVCSSTPHSQAEVDLRPHFFINAPNLPTPVRRRLNVVHCLRGRSWPGTWSGVLMYLCSLVWSAASHSSVFDMTCPTNYQFGRTLCQNKFISLSCALNTCTIMLQVVCLASHMYFKGRGEGKYLSFPSVF